MRVLLLRHGMTAGNREGRYIGRTDEPLCPGGEAQLRTLHFDPPALVVCSPMQRCVQTARIVFPGIEPIMVPDFRECDFGRFEGKNYRDLDGDPAYQAWIDAGGELEFPEGEAPAAFRRRCREAFAALLRAYPEVPYMALVVHGGTIMSILSERLGGNYFDYRLPNGGFATLQIP